MQMKDATRRIGRVALFIPLILIFLTTADSAFACPKHKTGVAYRTGTTITRTSMPTTVISYRAPASYRRCGDNMYDTRGARYVAVRSKAYSNGAKYVAVRNVNVRPTRYVTVRNVEVADAPRYVAVRRQPVYVDSGSAYIIRRSKPHIRHTAVRTVDIEDDDDLRYVAVRRHVTDPEPGARYIAVRSGYRKGNGIVAYIDADTPRYVAVQRAPAVRYVAVPSTRYVAVRNVSNGCMRAVALQSCADQIGTTSVKRVVVRNDDGYSKAFVDHDEEIDDDVSMIHDEDSSMIHEESDDDAYVVPSSTTRFVEFRDAAYSSDNDNIYIAANNVANTCSQPVAVSTCRPRAVSNRTIAYEVSDDDDWDDEVVLHQGVTHVATGDLEDACLSRQVVYTSPEVVTTRSLRYIPAEVVAQDSSILDSEPVSVVTEDAPLMASEPTMIMASDASLIESEPTSTIAERVVTSQPRWAALDEDEVFNDLDPTWVEEVEATTGADTVSYVPGGNVEVGGTAIAYVPVDDVDEMDTQTASYVPVEDVEDMETQTVSYVTDDDVEDRDMEVVSYMPVDDVAETHMQTVSYLPATNDRVSTVRYMRVDDDVDMIHVADDDCPIYVSNVNAEPISVAHVEDIEVDLVRDLSSTQLIAGRYGYRDGFEDGQEAALEGDVYHPENSGDYEKATEGYEDEFGDKDVYKDSYRSSYLDGYRAGFDSAAGSV